MLWEVELICRNGAKASSQVRNASRRACQVRLQREHDKSRNRNVLVARTSADIIPPLFDVQVLPNVGDFWVLSGYECQTNNCGEHQYLAQTWLLRPGPVLELEKADRMVQRLAAELDRLRAARVAEDPTRASTGQGPTR